MLKKGIMLVAGCCLMAMTVTHAKADDAGDAVSMVKKAVADYNASGFEQVTKDMSVANGKYAKGELYAFAYDLDGTMMAHPNAALIGKSTLNVPDVNGKLFRKEIIEKAKKQPQGAWTDYTYQNPKSKAVEQKTTYCENPGDLIICAGVYKK
jgi:signal transduction histidine kinase